MDEALSPVSGRDNPDHRAGSLQRVILLLGSTILAATFADLVNGPLATSVRRAC